MVEIQDETQPASVTLGPDLLTVYGSRDRDMRVWARPASKLDCGKDSGQVVFRLSLQLCAVVPSGFVLRLQDTTRWKQRTLGALADREGFAQPGRKTIWVA